jgi:YD repeat-containing protein
MYTLNSLPARPLLQYAYTDNGQRKTLTDANGNVTTYVYDDLDRPIQTQYPSRTLASGVSDPANYDAVQVYDANGNPLQLRKRDGAVITITYDALNRPLTKQYPNGLNPVYYSYDLASRLLSARYGSLTVITHPLAAGCEG